jgi:hypothetical protein
VLWRPLEDDKVLVVRAELNQLVLPVTAHVSDEKLVSCTVPWFGTCPSGDLRNLEQTPHWRACVALLWRISR